MVLEPEIFRYLPDDQTVLERDALELLATERQLAAYRQLWEEDKSRPRIQGFVSLVCAKDGSGWEALTAAANEATLEPVPERKGIMCSPASPKFDEMAADQVAKDTGTDPSEWGYPSMPSVEVHAAAKADAPVIEKLGMHLVRVMPEQPAAGVSEQQMPFLRVVTPSGKVGFVAEESISSLGTDQICYIKDATGWKIAGYAGSD